MKVGKYQKIHFAQWHKEEKYHKHTKQQEKYKKERRIRKLNRSSEKKRKEQSEGVQYGTGVAMETEPKKKRRKVESSDRVKCTQCVKTYANEKNLQKHLKAKHSENSK